ncbi:hypothetical protein FPV67DRAFT_1166138 [Lyophyllum atratum]|nr:hypothetical protein FPV67DRAFT_1166138 [Lyophyllum atratum]
MSRCLYDRYQFPVILFYDYIITFGDEVEYIWMRVRSRARSACLFFPNRYFFLVANAAMTGLPFTNILTKHVSTCRELHLARQISLVINQGLVSLLLSLRVCALYNCSWRISAFLLGSAAVLGAAALASQLIRHLDEPLPDNLQHGCDVAITQVKAIRLACAWGALFIYDAILFGLTLAKTWRMRRRHGNIPIPALVFRYGAIYFGVITLANAANIMTYRLCGPFCKGGLSLFSGCFSTVVTSRFMLQLHATSDLGIYRRSALNGEQGVAVSSCVWTTPDAVELDTIWTAELSVNPPPVAKKVNYHCSRAVSR